MPIDISKELLDILVCPLCKTEVQPVEHSPGEYGLKCSSCARIFPVRDGIPVMLADEAIESK